jgi:hypothetical protein
MKFKEKGRMSATDEELVYQYFKCIDDKDLDGILDLFDYDAVVHEPFSNVTGGLRGRTSIEPFLKVAMMANTNLRRTIKIDTNKTKDQTLTALITFEKGDKVKGRFTFGFEDGPEGKKIKSLTIVFD